MLYRRNTNTRAFGAKPGKRAIVALVAAATYVSAICPTSTHAQFLNRFDDGPLDLTIKLTSVYVGDVGSDPLGHGAAEPQVIVETRFDSPGVFRDARYCAFPFLLWDSQWSLLDVQLAEWTDAVTTPKHASFLFTYFENDEFYWPWEDPDPCDKDADGENRGVKWYPLVYFRDLPPYEWHTCTSPVNSWWPYLGIRISYRYTTPAPAAAVPSTFGAGPGDVFTVKVSPPRGSEYYWGSRSSVTLYRETQPGSGQFVALYGEQNPGAAYANLPVQIPAGMPGGDLKFRAHALVVGHPQSKGYVEFTMEICDQQTEFPIVSCKDHTAYLEADGTASIVPQDVNNGLLSYCGSHVMSVTPAAFTCADLGDNNVILDVHNDELGSQCVAQVTVVDAVAPQTLCQSQIVTLDAAGTGTVNAVDLDYGSTDNCGPVGVHQAYLSKWTHVVATWDRSGDAVLYIDGVEAARQNISGIAFANHPADFHQIGHAQGWSSTNRHWFGGMDDVQVFDRALTPAEAAELFSSFDGSIASATPTARWKFDETTGLVASEQSDAYPGTLTGFTNNDEQWGLGKSGNALVFDGANDAVTHEHALGQAGTIAHWLRPADPYRTMIAYYESDSGNWREGFGDWRDILEIHTFQSGGGWGLYYQDGSQGGSSFRIETPRQLPADSLTFTCADAGVHDVALIVQDASGNAGQCETVVEVREETPPTALCVPTLNLDLCTNGVEIGVGNIDNGSSDDCSGVFFLQLDRTHFDAADVGDNIVTMTVTDRSGNQSTCTSTVTINTPDEDNDGVLDCIDACPATAANIPVDSAGCPTDIPSGDCNRTGVVDLDDHAMLSACLQGPGSSLDLGCACFNFDVDGDVDLADFAIFQTLFNKM